jgi:hypothetical protein
MLTDEEFLEITGSLPTHPHHPDHSGQVGVGGSVGA